MPARMSPATTACQRKRSCMISSRGSRRPDLRQHIDELEVHAAAAMDMSTWLMRISRRLRTTTWRKSCARVAPCSSRRARRTAWHSHHEHEGRLDQVPEGNPLPGLVFELAGKAGEAGFRLASSAKPKPAETSMSMMKPR